MVEITIPMPEKVKISDLKVDGSNPNRMTPKQTEALKASMKKWGDIIPIITNKDLLIADGEQRWNAAKELGMSEVSVIRLPVNDVDRRLLRQVLNKLRGEHDLLLDAHEFDKIITAGHEQDLKMLLLMSDDRLEKYRHILNNETDASDIMEHTYEIAVECATEEEQKITYEKLRAQGYRCRVLIL